MINPDFDPLKILQDIALNQERLSENQQRISQAISDLVTTFNELNRRQCIQENTIRELQLALNTIKEETK